MLATIDKPQSNAAKTTQENFNFLEEIEQLDFSLKKNMNRICESTCIEQKGREFSGQQKNLIL
jgi:hypothetical protein